ATDARLHGGRVDVRSRGSRVPRGGPKARGTARLRRARVRPTVDRPVTGGEAGEAEAAADHAAALDRPPERAAAAGPDAPAGADATGLRAGQGRGPGPAGGGGFRAHRGWRLSREHRCGSAAPPYDPSAAPPGTQP